jgi:predicted RNA methylase
LDPTPRQSLLRLAAWSFVTLFAELVFIRWLSVETRVFAFYKNMALLSCLVGLGTGAMLGRRGKLQPWFLPALALFAALVYLVGPALVKLRPASSDEFLWLPGSPEAGSAARFHVAFALFFLLNTLVFHLGGQCVGAAFEELPPSKAYSANLLGSLAGVLAFTAASWLRTGPVWWFATVFLTCLLLEPRGRTLGACAGALALLLFWLVPRPAVWSPYSKITIEEATLSTGEPWGVALHANGMYYLTAVDLSPKFVAAHPELERSPEANAALEYYDLPYRHVARPKRVLVLGAGGGNDVAAALRAGAQEVVAVEIDPSIAELGRLFHPEHPYSDPRVHLVVDDARAFLSRPGPPFDLIVFGLIDSHSVISAVSHARLDAFVYTRESLELAKSLLAAGGTVSLSFSSGYGESGFILARIRQGLTEVFGAAPAAFAVRYDRGFVFLAGPGAPQNVDTPRDGPLFRAAAAHFAADQAPATTLTDDWPFLYLRGQWIPPSYWPMFGLVIAVALAMVLRLLPGGLRSVDPWFFLLGAGFLLVEVRNLAELSLLFGSTWLVNAFVIGGLLLMALLANLVSERFELPVPAAFAGLALAVAACFFSPVQLLASWPPGVREVAATLWLSAPFFFSGLVFSRTFRIASSSAAAFGSNLLGAVAGGLLEHASLVNGVRFLTLLSLAVYGVAALVWLRAQRRGAAA